ncbi:MAG: toll/interleukin-1 receptor domain-containing protein [Gammaproteobacteria bacterium]|nr:toll/interleukin-1 receptor domain-containing protein [Gammaproteobacteria bacterium]
MQEHLFISYATEDAALAEWLTLKLTIFGYKAWCDRFELLGGERFPRDIDQAIKEKTFRLLAILSKASLEKENPTKERTLALNIGKERKSDFLIPLQAEPLAPTDLNWMVSDITYIPFHESWSTGLRQLLKKLEKISTPQNLVNGGQVASTALLDTNCVVQ